MDPSGITIPRGSGSRRGRAKDGASGSVECACPVIALFAASRTGITLTRALSAEHPGAHEAALAHGGTSEGAPGFRPHYNVDFYAAYVRDPDGNKLAAVCRGFT